MRILAITACTAGIAHTYIAKEKLENAAKELGDSIKVETQGSIGVERIDSGRNQRCRRDFNLCRYSGK